MIVKETPSNKTTVTTAQALPANGDRKKLKVTNLGSSILYLNFSGTTATSSIFDEQIAAKGTLTIENYVGECKASASIRYVEFE